MCKDYTIFRQGLRAHVKTTTIDELRTQLLLEEQARRREKAEEADVTGGTPTALNVSRVPCRAGFSQRRHSGGASRDRRRRPEVCLSRRRDMSFHPEQPLASRVAGWEKCVPAAARWGPPACRSEQY